MTTLATILLVGAGLVAAVDWWSVARDRVGVEYLAKPLVIVALVGVALALDVSDDTARGLVVAALGASLVGDVALLAPEGPFEGGLGAFLIAHLLYVVALVDSIEPAPTVVGGLAVVALAGVALPRIVRGARADGRFLSFAVVVYAAVLCLMATFAVGTGVWIAAAGGGLFLISDALLGWGRFVGPAPGGRTGVHVTYHLGQTGLVLWLAA